MNLSKVGVLKGERERAREQIGTDVIQCRGTLVFSVLVEVWDLSEYRGKRRGVDSLVTAVWAGCAESGCHGRII